MKVIFRGYIQGKLVFQERMDVQDDAEITDAAERHHELLGGQPYMIEIEFLDELDPMRRFHRIGTDTRGMVLPIAINLSKRSN